MRSMRMSVFASVPVLALLLTTGLACQGKPPQESNPQAGTPSMEPTKEVRATPMAPQKNSFRPGTPKGSITKGAGSADLGVEEKAPLGASSMPGRKVFEMKCSQCHGKDIKGQAKLAKVLKVDPSLLDLTRKDAVQLTEGEMIKTVTSGNKKMPKFGGKLTPGEIKETVEYLRVLQAP